VHARVTSHPRITLERGELTSLPSPGIVATGPLTSSALAEAIRSRLGVDALAFYDAIAPIVSDDSIDHDVVFRASRYGKETMEGEGDGAYLNCPMTREQYEAFLDALTSADKATAHEFDAVPYFEGCMPAEEMARRGRETLRFGPMKPVGLVDPRTGREAYAVVQLRQDNLAGDHFSLVGFQTQMKWGEQARVLKLIPGLEQAEFVRFGMIHRNTYINGPTVLRETWQTKTRDDLFFAGQISGVEGYVESAASGLLAGRNAAALVLGEPISVPPRTTAIGALAYYVSHAAPQNYQPTNIAFGIIPALVPEAGRRVPRKKADRKVALSERALADLDVWMESFRLPSTRVRSLRPEKAEAT
jgi:methylenetetrahydrofolate--tRNA-(uracil-5-)-methyltransferase